MSVYYCLSPDWEAKCRLTSFSIAANRNGVASGRVTPSETSRLEAHDADVNHDVRNERQANGGTLTVQKRQQVKSSAKQSEQIDLQRQIQPAGQPARRAA
jgi:hypothetical protein